MLEIQLNKETDQSPEQQEQYLRGECMSIKTENASVQKPM